MLLLKPLNIINLNAVVFGIFGSIFLVAPVQASKIVTDASPLNSSAVMDMRATYGGALIGVALTLLLLGRQKETHAIGVLTSAFVLLGMAVGRVVGMALDGPANPSMFVFLAYELLVGAFAIIALRLHNYGQ